MAGHFCSKERQFHPRRHQLYKAHIAVAVATGVAPGLSATAEIITDERRVIDYLLSPLERTLSEACAAYMQADLICTYSACR